MKHKPIHSSWKIRAMKETAIDKSSELEPFYYLRGAKDFRKKSLEALEIFSVLTNEQPVIYNNKMYVSLDDVKELIEGLYAKVTKTKVKNDE